MLQLRKRNGALVNLVSLYAATLALMPLSTLAYGKSSHVRLHSKAITLCSRPGTYADHIARTLSKTELRDAASHHDQPVILVAERALSPAGRNLALFVQLQSARLCGSAGCSTSIYLKRHNHWDSVFEAITGTISLLPQIHKGFHDLLVDHKDRWVWDGSSYQEKGLTHSAVHRTPSQKSPTRPTKVLRG